MSPLSTNTLFHFTSSIDNLLGILRNEFRPHYCFEDFDFTPIAPATAQTEDLSAGFPIVSFCDIPLSQATRHMATYGSYALGLTKEWGIRNGVAPVLYSYPSSVAAGHIGGLLTVALRVIRIPQPETKSEERTAPVRVLQAALELRPLLKAYEGPFLHRGRTIPVVRFYDEREWRWVPREHYELPTLSRDEYLDFANLRQANELAWKFATLSFEPSDIRYIIVSSDAELLPMIRKVEGIKHKYSDDQVKVLTSRLVSAEQIIADF